MTNKAISKEHKCAPYKMGLDRNPYIQMDIDCFIGHLKSEIEKYKDTLENHEGTMYEEYPFLLKELERYMDAYEGLLGMIEANSFR